MKTTKPLFGVFTITAALAGHVQAQDYACTTNNGTITITSYRGSGGAVIIPDTINGLPVTDISDSAFYHRTNLISVTIPNSVTSIGPDAFYFCTGLAAVTIPNSVTNIGSHAFYFCTGLTNVNIPNSIANLGHRVFELCTGLTSATMPDTVARLRHDVFHFCDSLNDVSVVNSVVAGLGDLTVDPLQPGAAIEDRADSLYAGLSDGLRGGSDWAWDTTESITSRTYHFFQFSHFNILGPGKIATQPRSDLCSGRIHTFNLRQAIERVLAYDANTRALSVLDSDTNATSSYLPETTPRGPAFDSVPAALWNPLSQTADGRLGLISNQFGFNITGTANIPLLVEACTNLSNPTWVPLQTSTLTNGSMYFTDPQWTNYPARFYRIRSP